MGYFFDFYIIGRKNSVFYIFNFRMDAMRLVCFLFFFCSLQGLEGKEVFLYILYRLYWRKIVIIKCFIIEVGDLEGWYFYQEVILVFCLCVFRLQSFNCQKKSEVFIGIVFVSVYSEWQVGQLGEKQSGRRQLFLLERDFSVRGGIVQVVFGKGSIIGFSGCGGVQGVFFFLRLCQFLNVDRLESLGMVFGF